MVFKSVFTDSKSDIVITSLANAMKGLSASQLEAYITTNKLNVAQAAAAMKTAGVTREERIQVLTKTGLITQTSAQIAANGGLTVSLKSITAALLEQAKAWLASPLGMATVAVVGIYALIKIIDHFNVTLEESREKLSNLKEEFDSITSELTSLESELASTTERIEELQKLAEEGSISFTEQEELDLLQEQNRELDRKINLLKMEQELKQAEINKSFVETANKELNNQKEYTLSNELVSDNYVAVNPSTKKYGRGRTVRTINEQEYIDAVLMRRSELIDELSGDITEQEEEKLNNLLTQIDTYLGEKCSELRTDLGTVSYVKDAVTEDQKAANEAILMYEDVLDKIAIATGQSSARTDAFWRLIDTEFSTTTENLRDLGEQGKVTAEHLRAPEYDEFIQKLLNIGVISDTTDDSLNFIVLGFNELGDSASGAANLLGSAEAELNAILNNFESFSDTVDDITDSFTTLAKIQQEVADGFTLSLDKALEFASVYPEILQGATATADGQLKLNEEVVNSFIQGKQTELNAQIDSEIAKLEADKAVLEAKMESAQAQLSLAKAAAEGEGGLTKELLEYRLNSGNALTAALIEMKVSEADAYALTAAAMAGNEEEFARVASECFQNMDENAAKAAYNMANSIFTNAAISCDNIAAIAAQAHQTAAAIAYMGAGMQAGVSYSIHSGSSGYYAGGYDLDLYQGTFNGETYDYEYKEISLDDFISDLELDISSYENAIAQINGQIAVLEALRNTPFESFISASNASSGSSSSGSSTVSKEVEEYIAAIDEYASALNKLEDVQRRRESLEKQLSHSENATEKILLSKELSDAYLEEAQAEQELMDAKRKTISANVSALRRLGFEVKYNAEENRLYIQNLEHLNELTATSVGEYDTLQEATNALRKEAEELIEVTEQLNSENVNAASSIEDLTYEALEAKKAIADYIEEIYDKQIEAYNKVIDKRKELIQSAKDEYDYESEIADKVEEIANLQVRIDQLSLDDSREAQAERNTLLEELKEKQSELGDLQNDHAIEVQISTLDKSAENFEEQKESELDIIRQTVETSDELWNAFYQTLLGNTVEVADTINSQIVDAWISAAIAARNYSSTVSGLTSGGSVAIDDLPVYHTGGIVDEPNLNAEETLAVLQTGEIVLDEPKKENLYRIIDSLDEMYSWIGVAVENLSFPKMSFDTGNILDDITSKTIESSQRINFEPHIDVVIQHSGTLNDTDASNFGSRIAETAIDALYSAFERRGVTSNRSSRLKP